MKSKLYHSAITQQILKKAIILVIIYLIGLPFLSINNYQTNASFAKAKYIQNTRDEITTVFLVRHAEKIKSTTDDPVLHPDGVERSKKLCELLSEAGISRIYSTDYIRTKETVRPLAELLNQEIIIYSPGKNQIVSDIINKDKGLNILISGHSNTIPGLVNKLIKEEKYKQINDDVHNKIFIVSLSKKSSKCSVILY